MEGKGMFGIPIRLGLMAYYKASFIYLFIFYFCRSLMGNLMENKKQGSHCQLFTTYMAAAPTHGTVTGVGLCISHYEVCQEMQKLQMDSDFSNSHVVIRLLTTDFRGISLISPYSY